MNNNNIPFVSVPLESYVFLLICRSKYDYAVIDKEHVSYIKLVKNHEDYCHIEPIEDSSLFKLWRLDHWTAEKDRRDKQRSEADITRQINLVRQEHRRVALQRLQTMLPTISESHAKQMIQWAEEGKMQELKTKLNL